MNVSHASKVAWLATVFLVTACGSSTAGPATSVSAPSVPVSTVPPSVTTASTSPPTPSTTASSSVPPTSASTTSTTGGGLFDSCSVVTSAEASAALGSTVGAGVLGHATVEGGLACVFYGPQAPAARNPDVAQTDTVRVVVVQGSLATHYFDDYRSKVAARAVTGYGSSAYWDGYASLSVLSGSSYLRVAVAPAGAPPSLSAEERLATAILPGL